MADPVKRLNYFEGEFLRAPDFSAEQSYHAQNQREHERLLHTPGIAEGLGIVLGANSSAVTVTAGTAYDGLGRRIVLAANQLVELAGQPAGQAVFLTVAYRETQTDPTTETGISGNTRWTEAGLIELSASAPADPTAKLLLGRVVRTGTVATSVDQLSARLIAGMKGGDLQVNSLQLTSPSIAPSGWVKAQLGVSGRADLAGNLRVAGNLIVTGTIQGDIAVGTVQPGDLADNAVQSAAIAEADGSSGQDANAGAGVKTAHLQDGAVTTAKIAAAARPIASIDGVSNPGGNIDLVPANAITISPDNGTKQITLGESHSGRTDNPHGTTAAQVGALPLNGGGLLQGQITTKSFEERTSISILGSPFNGIRGAIGTTADFTTFAAGVSGQAFGANNGVGVYAKANGTNMVALFVDGGATFLGGKSGYVVDTFINASGTRLRTGDIVKLKGTPISRFFGDGNKLPVAEVTLADAESDNLVIGVVDREAIPSEDVPDTRVGAEDHTFIEEGGELYVVTLGVYSHCKVDARGAPIAVGDLLTSSSKAGFARKATKPKLGSIIGKALEPLEKGTGYIAVFVNIQ